MSNYGMTATVAAVLLGLSGSLAAAPITTSTVYDTAETQYIGADGGQYGDVVGDRNKFDIDSMDIEQDGNEFKFFINTEFAYGAGVYPGLTVGGTGIGYGDLFLANEWDPAGEAADGYASDNASNGTDWTWGLILSNRFENEGGEVFLAKLTGSNEDSALLSNHFMNAAEWQYRNGQEVAVDTGDEATQKGHVDLIGNVGTWSLGDNQLKIFADLTSSDLLNGDTLAFHWGMTCANDVIEGQVDLKKVPEPGTIGLVSLALAGMFIMRRRSKAA